MSEQYSMRIMATAVAQMHELNSVDRVRRWFYRTYRRAPPSRPSIRSWVRRFSTTGSVAHRNRSGRPRISQDITERVQELFESNPGTSIRAGAAVVGISRGSVYNILRRRLFLFPYKLQILQALSENDCQSRLNFTQYCRYRPEGFMQYLSKIVFFDECIFHLNGFVNKQNVRIWGESRPVQVNQASLNSASVMVWCAISKEKVIGPYFFESENVTAQTYRHMLMQYAFQ